MAMISWSKDGNWFSSRRLMVRIIERAKSHITRADDEKALDDDLAVGGVTFDLYDREQATRIAAAIVQAVVELRAELAGVASPTRPDRWVLQNLPALEAGLRREFGLYPGVVRNDRALEEGAPD
jgi:hypothetical protein